ncbi:hypothetical protein E4K73_47530 [Streptomyces sp. IB201691-2A2]|nr:hypothetical protein E4K73_47530 [Streptomyces sp. IB201691-2A2]
MVLLPTPGGTRRAHSLPEYDRGACPDHLATRRQLRDRSAIPGGHDERCHHHPGVHLAPETFGTDMHARIQVPALVQAPV